MRRLSLGLVIALALSRALSAQVSSVSIQQNLTSATCPGSGCVALAVSGYGGIAVQITGTYSGTVSFEGSVDGVTFTALNLTPTNSTTAATSTTSTGVWSGGMGGLTTVRARMSSYTSGTASVSLKTAPTAARGGGGGGATIPVSCADTEVLFDDAGSVGCDPLLTWANSEFTLGPADSTMPVEIQGYDGQATLRYNQRIGQTITGTGDWGLYVNAAGSPTSVGGGVLGIEADAIIYYNSANKSSMKVFEALPIILSDGLNNFTVPIVKAYDVEQPTLDAHAFLTNWHGIYIEDPAGYHITNESAITIQALTPGGGTTYAVDYGSGLFRVDYAGLVTATGAMLTTGTALKGDTTTGHTWLVQGYDTDTGPAYVTFATITNGTAPSLVIAPPTGGATVSVQGSYKSADGTIGATVTTCTGYKNGLCISGT